MYRNIWKFVLCLMIFIGLLGCDRASHTDVSPVESGLAQMLPADTIFFMNFPNLGNQDRGFHLTNIGKLFQEPEVQLAFEPLKNIVMERLALAKAMLQQTGRSVESIESLLVGEVGVAVTALPSPENPIPSLVISMDVDETQMQELLEELEGTLSQMPPEMYQSLKIGGYKFHGLSVPMFPTPILFGLVEKRFLMISSKELAEHLLGMKMASSLAKAPSFVELVSSTVGKSDVAFHTYINLESIWNSPLVPMSTVGICKTFGIANWKSIAVSFGYENERLRQSIAIYCPGDKIGITKIFQGETCKSSLLRFIPQDAISYYETGWNMHQSFREFCTLLSLMPQGNQLLQDYVQPELLLDVLQCHTSEMATFKRSPQGGSFFNDQVILLGISNKGMLAEKLSTFFSRWGFELKKITYQNQEIFYWQNKVGDGGRIFQIERNFDPQLLGLLNIYRSYMFLEENVVAYSNSIHSLKNYAEFLQKKTATLEPVLAKELKNYGPHSSWSWGTKEAGNYSVGYRNLLSTLQSFEGIIRSLGIPIEIAKLPRAEVVEKYWLPGTEVGECTDKKLAYTYYSSGIIDFSTMDVPSLGGATSKTAVIGIISAIAVPGILQSRNKANEASAIGTLKSMCVAQSIFQMDGIIDQDKDGIGEYGFLQELASVSLREGTLVKSNPSYISPMLGTEAQNNDGIAIKNGYCYVCYLPDGESYMKETSPLPDVSKDEATINAQELKYIIYAWPQEYGSTGKQAFMVDYTGELYQCTNDGRYSGIFEIPRASAKEDDGSWRPLH